MSLYVNLPLRDDQLCIANAHLYAGKDFPFHYHPEIEITCVLRSNGLRVVGDSIESYAKHDLVAIGPHIPHQWQKDERFKRQGGDQEQIIVIHLHEKRLRELVDGTSELHPLKALLDEMESGLTFSIETSLKAQPLMWKLVEQDEGIGAFIALFELLELLLGDEGRRTLGQTGFGHRDDSAGRKQIFGIVDYLLANHHKPIRAADVARGMNLSPSAFSHYFKKRTAKSFRRYLNDIRLGNACKMLQQTEKSVAEICFECGFNNVSNFNRLFKGAYSRTPKEYRARMRRLV